MSESSLPVSCTITGATAFLQIERPESLNAINQDVILGLQKHINMLRQRNDVGVVVLSGAGDKAFVAGADLKFMQDLSATEAQKFSALGQEVFSALESLPQIVIARVQGFALGGGLELAMGSDFIVASEKARFGLPEVSLGLIPGFGGTQRLARRIGLARAIEWVSTAEKYSAESALSAGLVNHVVPHADLGAFTEKLTASILKNGPAAVRAAKSVMRRGAECPLVSGLALEAAEFGICFSNAESKEGIGAFVGKRAADFKRPQA